MGVAFPQEKRQSRDSNDSHRSRNRKEGFEEAIRTCTGKGTRKRQSCHRYIGRRVDYYYRNLK